jgi:hypothetical protein
MFVFPGCLIVQSEPPFGLNVMTESNFTLVWSLSQTTIPEFLELKQNLGMIITITEILYAQAPIPEFLERPQEFCMISQTTIPKFLELPQNFGMIVNTDDSRISGTATESRYGRASQSPIPDFLERV